jgi:hypothetical protein
MTANLLSTNLRHMQLIQIGETKQKTVLEMIQEMAANQFAEIAQLKAAAQKRSESRHSGRTRQRCSSAKRQG